MKKSEPINNNAPDFFENAAHIIEMTLPENSNIYASEYNLYLPDKALL